MNVFGDYSEYYDLLYEEKDYLGEANYILSLIEEYAPNCSSVLELGCGTGKHAIELAKKGFCVHGVDLSDQMIKLAKNLTSKETKKVVNRISLSQGDVRSYRCKEKFDVCLSLFHVISYQTSNKDLMAVFETAASILKPGGVFIFDYWYGPSVLTQKPEVRVKKLENEKLEINRTAIPEMFLNENKVHVNYTVSVVDKSGGELQKIKETHKMRYLFLPEIEMLSQPNFSTQEHFGWMKKDIPNADDWAGLTILEYLG